MFYRRQVRSCRHSSRTAKAKCKCLIWVQGTLAGESIRRSLDLTSMEAASNLIHEWNAKGEIGSGSAGVVTIEDAVLKFIADAKARQLRDSTIGGSRIHPKATAPAVVQGPRNPLSQAAGRGHAAELPRIVEGCPDNRLQAASGYGRSSGSPCHLEAYGSRTRSGSVPIG